MAKLTPEQFGSLLKSSLAQLNSNSFLRELGAIASEAIRTRTRAGYGVEAQRVNRLKALKESTIKRRESLAKNGKLHPKTAPKFSNLTRSGQLLDSIETLEIKKNSVVVGPQGERDDSEHSNAEIAEFVAEQGRPFNDLAPAEQRKVVNAVELELVRIARRLT